MLVHAPLAFLFPLDAVVLLLFPQAVGEGWDAVKQATIVRGFDRRHPDWLLLLLHITLGGFVVLLIGAVATGASHYLERYMHPFFLPTPLWLLGLAATPRGSSPSSPPCTSRRRSSWCR